MLNWSDIDNAVADWFALASGLAGTSVILGSTNSSDGLSGIKIPKPFAVVDIAQSLRIGQDERVPDASDSLTLSVDTVLDNTDYTTTVSGIDFVIDSGVSATAASIVAALVALVTAGTLPVTATDNLDGTYLIDSNTSGLAISVFVDVNQSITKGDGESIRGIREFTASFQTFGDASFQLMSDAQANIQRIDLKVPLENVGVAIMRDEGVLDITEFIDTSWEKRASMDVFMSTSSVIREETGVIESVEGAITILKPDSTIAVSETYVGSLI